MKLWKWNHRKLWWIFQIILHRTSGASLLFSTITLCYCESHWAIVKALIRPISAPIFSSCRSFWRVEFMILITLPSSSRIEKWCSNIVIIAKWSVNWYHFPASESNASSRSSHVTVNLRGCRNIPTYISNEGKKLVSIYWIRNENENS